MNNICKKCEYQARCEDTRIQLCKLKDNEHVEKINGEWIIQRDWLYVCKEADTPFTKKK